MHMLLLIGVSVGFVLSVLTSNNFYSEKTFISSANQWICNEMKGEKTKGCQDLIAQASASDGLPWNVDVDRRHKGDRVSSGQRSRNPISRLFKAISKFFRGLF